MNTQNFYTKSGIVCPRLGVGCFAYGDSPNQWGATIETEQAVQIMLELYTRGLRVFDTADVYGFRKEFAGDLEKDGFGESERRLGQVIKEVGRENLFIATKGGRYRGFSAIGNYSQKPHERNFDSAYIREAFEQSLQRLGTDYIDLYQLHGPHIKTEEHKEQAFAALEVLIDIQCALGPQRLRYVGVSVNDVSEALWYLAIGSGGVGADVIQLPYNMLQHKDAQRVFERAEKEGVAIIAREPLAKGFLAGRKGKYTHDTWTSSAAFPGTIKKYLKRVARGMDNDPKDERNLEIAYHHLVDRVEKIVTLLSTYDEDYNPSQDSTLTQCALRFALAPSAVTAVIPSISKPQHIDDCLGALRNWNEYEGDVGFGLHPLELDTLDDIVFAKDDND